jgi:hypothetical protein
MKPYSIIIAFLFSVLLTISCEKSDNPKDNETEKISTEYLFYEIWYNNQNQVTKYIISDSSAVTLQETNFEFTDSLINESTFSNSKYSMKLYKLDENGKAYQCIDSTIGSISQYFYYYNNQKLTSIVEYPVSMANEDSLYAMTKIEFRDGNRYTKDLCYDVAINGYFSTRNTCFDDYRYSDISMPKLDIILFNSDIFGERNHKLPSEYGQYCWSSGPGTGSSWYRYKSFSYQMTNDSLVSIKRDSIYSNNLLVEKVVVNEFKYHKD